jgi:hypothetical protein
LYPFVVLKKFMWIEVIVFIFFSKVRNSTSTQKNWEIQWIIRF